MQMPLPCSRDLWRATSSAAWEKEYLTRSDSMTGEKRLLYEDLLQCRSRTDGRLESWLSELDDFGSLVMAAASLAT